MRLLYTASLSGWSRSHVLNTNQHSVLRVDSFMCILFSKCTDLVWGLCAQEFTTICIIKKYYLTKTSDFKKLVHQ